MTLEIDLNNSIYCIGFKDGDILFEGKKYNEALEEYLKYLKNPNKSKEYYIYLLYMISLCYKELGENEEMIKYKNEGLALIDLNEEEKIKLFNNL